MSNLFQEKFEGKTTRLGKGGITSLLASNTGVGVSYIRKGTGEFAGNPSYSNGS